ncbi:MAG TPA: outer membrane protein transport protein [Polyangiaceae bacterium]|jgi:long-chain fatty acid transport protein|nr:outer membrane protein transport protein [Polyangiaceae bacterium]
MKKILALSIGLFAFHLATNAHASGFSVDVQSARATGMATAVTGMIDDSSAIFFNPAGIARGRGIDAQASVSVIMPSATFKDTSGHETTTPFSAVPPFQAYVATGLTDHLTIGVGLFEPFGLAVKWPDGWEGRSQITDAKLTTYYANPTAAYSIGPLRIGAGVQVVYSTVDLKRDIALPSGAYGMSELGGDGWGVGGNVGIQIDAIRDMLSFGAHYRSAVAVDYGGNAAFDGIPASLGGTLHDQPATTRIVMPDTFAFGVAFRPIPRLVFDLDVVYYGWSHIQSIDLAFPNDQSGTLNQSLAKNWSGTVQAHLGTEYAFNDTWRIRGGMMYDPSPSPKNTLTPDLPDSDRVNIAVGGSWHHASGVYVDVAYEGVILLGATSTAPELPGTYSGYANILALAVGYATPHKRTHR